jgi:hypothetical protein
MSDMMQRCMDVMSGCSMMESGMMDSNPMSWILPLALALLLVWALGLATLGALCVGVLELQNTLSWPSSFLGTAYQGNRPLFQKRPFSGIRRSSERAPTNWLIYEVFAA